MNVWNLLALKQNVYTVGTKTFLYLNGVKLLQGLTVSSGCLYVYVCKSFQTLGQILKCNFNKTIKIKNVMREWG